MTKEFFEMYETEYAEAMAFFEAEAEAEEESFYEGLAEYAEAMNRLRAEASAEAKEQGCDW